MFSGVFIMFIGFGFLLFYLYIYVLKFYFKSFFLSSVRDLQWFCQLSPPYPDLHNPTEVALLSRKRGEGLNIGIRESFLWEAQPERKVPTSHLFSH